MRVVRVLIVLPMALSLQACFFVWIPGSVIQAAGDALSGAEGQHCVSTVAKVGDRISLPNGTTWQVASLSGASSRCTNPDHPIRAKLTPVTS